MKAGIAALTAAYVLSQFYRAFLAVLAPDLTAALGVAPGALSRASGLWFLCFAAMQIPVGWALDRLGPRRTAGALLAVGGGGGAALFAQADALWQVELAMALIGAGCAPVLMANYYIFARTYPPAVFATLAGVLVGVGSLGNIAASLPLGLAAEAFGWRGAIWAMAALTLAVAGACAMLVRDPPPPAGETRGSLADVLRIRGLWPVLALMLVCYAPAAGLRGLWAGPWVAEVHGEAFVGTATLIMGLAMIAGNFLYGPADRLFGTRKGVMLVGNLLCAGVLAALWWQPAPGPWTGAALLAAIGALGSSFVMGIAHGRAFLPPHLVGRGVTLLNLAAIGGVGVMQVATGPVFAAAGGGIAGFRMLFGIFALALAAGCAIYLRAPDRVD